jgi:hypothetical protein
MHNRQYYAALSAEIDSEITRRLILRDREEDLMFALGRHLMANIV